MCFFFYGTLLDHDVRRAVLGPVADRLEPEAAQLRDWHRVRFAGRVYPVIVPRAGRMVEGCIVRGLPASAVVRLRQFEGPEYLLARVRVTADSGSDVLARAFVGSGRLAPSTVSWHLEDWTRRYKAALLRQLRRPWRV
jgi:hypothetical protein